MVENESELKDQIIGDVDGGIQTRRKMTNTPNKNDIALLSPIGPENFTQARLLTR